jgi:hypothetical protein
MDPETVANLTAIIGVSAEEASYFLEMTGGDLESAISMFYDMGSSGAVIGNANDCNQNATSEPNYPAWYSTVWPKRSPIDPSWLEQGIEFSQREVRKILLLLRLLLYFTPFLSFICYWFCWSYFRPFSFPGRAYWAVAEEERALWPAGRTERSPADALVAGGTERLGYGMGDWRLVFVFFLSFFLRVIDLSFAIILTARSELRAVSASAGRDDGAHSLARQGRWVPRRDLGRRYGLVGLVGLGLLLVGFLLVGFGLLLAGLGFLLVGLSFILVGLGFLLVGLGFLLVGFGFLLVGLGFFG